ncbi:DDE-type integrase/transposase/recombinase [Hyphomonas oceanitis]|uniref:Integrase catalytic subunit n=1 Tax=Hyphomonas oceanitis SCH89 TaxID=1280953 RepID=A0A059G2P2_9PROT|nr:integrase catalytic subunit [Hyphomonas oceanitis SCH89]|tara:strand:+ start:82 stop:396 length:315 start_codon:yes stop_codon:yes gene_type:complete
MAVHREARCQPSGLNEAWSLDFVHDQLSCSAKIRLLTVIDIYSRECLAIEVGSRLRGEDVARVLNRLVYLRGAPKALFADNVLRTERDQTSRQKAFYPQNVSAA